MENITFWQLGPGQNRNRGCDTIMQSNKTFSRRLFNAVEISGLIAFSKNYLSVIKDIRTVSYRMIHTVRWKKDVRTGKNEFTAALHAANVESLLQATYCMKLPTLKTVFMTTSRTQKSLEIIHSTN